MATVSSVWFRPSTVADGYLPEGPRSFGDGVGWVNIQAGADATIGHIHTQSWAGNHHRYTLPARPGFWLPTSRPGVVLAGCDKVVGLFDLSSDEWTPLAAIPDTHPRTIINDAEILPGGRAVVFGTKDTSFAEPLAHLYLFTIADNAVSVLAAGQTCSNGKVFADGGRVLYDIDTPRKVVTRYQFDLVSRTIRDDGIALDLRHRDDFPDGMCDAGNETVIVAFYNPNPAEYGTAVRYRLGTGEILHEWQTPASPRVTCPLLTRRPDGVKLLLTTAVEGMPAEQLIRCENAGCVFVADASGCGPPVQEVVLL
ncbi:MAG: SMP-30/gluconolactonase/LRE family protein [Fimbriiglobus sp.]|jgi:sugar lactone lactonase YvrE|nr:SMP-30/gluconolactonase/LRE family protein [Fimbriiglobus sp.]